MSLPDTLTVCGESGNSDQPGTGIGKQGKRLRHVIRLLFAIIPCLWVLSENQLAGCGRLVADHHRLFHLAEEVANRSRAV